MTSQSTRSYFSNRLASRASDFVANVIDDESSEKYTEFPDTFSRVSLDIVEDRVMNVVEEQVVMTGYQREFDIWNDYRES